MVHRILGPKLVAVLALGVVTSGMALSPPPLAWAYCRTTTCAVTNPPPECVRDDHGCHTAGIPLTWEEQCIPMAVAFSGSPRLGLDYAAAETITVRGFGLWLTGACADGFPSIAVMSRGPLVCNDVEYNPSGPNANSVLFRDQGWTHDQSAIALTTVAFSPRTGNILDVDMEINSAFSLAPQSLEYVIAHEAGHFFGLDHSPDPTALMYFRYAIDDSVIPTLKPDDQAAICAAYPPTRPAARCNFEPAQGFAIDCGGNVTGSCAVAPTAPDARSWGGALLGLALLGAATYRWRRFRPR